MSDKLLKIPIVRFEAGKNFAQDVFLHLALNGRYVRVAALGTNISPELITRMGTKGVTHLFVATDGQDGLNPDTFPIYSTATALGSEKKDSPAITSDSGTEKKIAAGKPEAETSQSFAATPADKLEEMRFGASKENAPEGSITIKGSKEAPAEETLVFENTAALNDEGNVLLAKLKTALIAEKLSVEANTFRKAIVATPIKDRKKHRRDFTALSEAADRIVGDRVDALTERKFDIEKELKPFLSLGTKPTEESMAEASDRIVSALKELPMGQKHLKEANKLITESEGMRESAALSKLGKKIEKKPKTELEKSELVQDVKNSLMVNKISDEIIKFSADKPKKEEEQRFSNELATLERALDTVSAGGQLPKEVEQRFSADKEAEEMVTVFSSSTDDAANKISDQIKIAADRREAAMEELQKQRTDGSLVRAKSHRDLPTTASRLAAYLGYCLGYTNVSLLSDLALTAVLHFAKKEEAKLSEGEVPVFVKNLLDNKFTADFVAQDAAEILQIVDAYMSNPECDREQKDFVKRIFDRTIEALIEDKKELDAINVAKWTKFVERGPDLVGHSICVKASANAVKQSRSIII